MDKITYPQFRKYLNGQNYFKIISPEEMTEIRFVGTKCFVNLFKAKILPDRNLIYDLTFDHRNIAEEISAEEFERVLSTCRSSP